MAQTPRQMIINININQPSTNPDASQVHSTGHPEPLQASRNTTSDLIIDLQLQIRQASGEAATQAVTNGASGAGIVSRASSAINPTKSKPQRRSTSHRDGEKRVYYGKTWEEVAKDEAAKVEAEIAEYERRMAVMEAESAKFRECRVRGKNS